MKYLYKSVSALFVCFFIAASAYSEPEEGSLTESTARTTLNPGILVQRDGSWLWSDHLFNLPKNIDILIELTKPNNLDLPVKSKDVEDIVAKVFAQHGITPYASPVEGKPNLPSFHVLIMVYPIRDGYTFTVIGRLFEGIHLERVKLDQRVTMQAVTWDRTSIHVVSTSKFKEELEESVREVSKEFADRYTFFEKLRLQNE